MPNSNGFDEHASVPHEKTKSGRPRRNLRSRSKNLSYQDSFLDDEEKDENSFDINEKLTSENFSDSSEDCVKIINGSELTVEYFQRNGFEYPLLVKENNKNGMLVHS